MPAGEASPLTSATGSYITLGYRGVIRNGAEMNGNGVMAVELHFLSDAPVTSVSFNCWVAQYASTNPDQTAYKCYMTYPEGIDGEGDEPAVFDFNTGHVLRGHDQRHADHPLQLRQRAPRGQRGERHLGRDEQLPAVDAHHLRCGPHLLPVHGLHLGHGRHLLRGHAHHALLALQHQLLQEHPDRHALGGQSRVGARAELLRLQHRGPHLHRDGPRRDRGRGRRHLHRDQARRRRLLLLHRDARAAAGPHAQRGDLRDQRRAGGLLHQRHLHHFHGGGRPRPSPAPSRSRPWPATAT